MILNENLYRALINSKKDAYDKMAQEKFKELNQNVNVEQLSEQATLLHQLQVSGVPFRHEDFDQSVHLELEQLLERVNQKFLDGTYQTPQFTIEEITKLLIVTEEDIKNCLMENLYG